MRKTLSACWTFAKYLPEQAWWYAEDELTDRSEKFLASELVREKLFRLTGDELPYTSTVVIDKFEEEPPRRATKAPASHCRHHRGGAGHPQGDGDRRQRRANQAHRHGTRVELEKLADAKVFH
jgi:GTP-binding protein Era